MATLAVLGSSAVAPVASSATVQPLVISVDTPARIGLPIWVRANLHGDLTARYPFQDDPRYFGSNQLELKRDGQALAPQRGHSSGGLVGRVEGSIAPPTSPQNRLPLNLGFVIDKPGRYSVRWTVIGSSLAPGVLTQSEWLDFEVGASAPAARETWLTQLLRTPPTETGAFVGDYLPALLAAAPDPRVAQAVIDATYLSDPLMSSCALAGLRVFPAERIVPVTLRTLQERGPNKQLAYFASWNASWFQDHREEIVSMAVSALTSDDDAVLVGGLQFLNFAPHFDWPDDTPLRKATRSLKTAAPRLMTRSDDVAHQLATTLGGTMDPEVRPLLNEIAAKHASAREQAQIAIRWVSGPLPQTHERAPAPLSEAVTKLEAAASADRKLAADTLMRVAQRGQQDQGSVAAYLVNDVIRQRRNVNADTWRDAALILSRLQSPLASGLTVYLERDGAAAALMESGNVVTEAVVDVLKVGGPARRRLAAQVLGALGNTVARDALGAALKTEPDVNVKRAIEEALVHFGQRGPAAEIR
ncbi:MAG TPA: hypothetical protein VGJ18_06210 [Gemmatimonadaceae bacterium]